MERDEVDLLNDAFTINNNVRREELSDNWRSALCVTSLYDSYIQLQKENEQLQHEIQQLQIIQVPSNTKQYKEIDSNRNNHFIEIELLQKEKNQQEKYYMAQIKHLEMKIQEYKDLYETQLKRFNQKYEVDPQETKRVAVSVQILQTSLEKVTIEKDELNMKLRNMENKWKNMEDMNNKTIEKLSSEVLILKDKVSTYQKHQVLYVVQYWIQKELHRSIIQWKTKTLHFKVQKEANDKIAAIHQRLCQEIKNDKEHRYRYIHLQRKRRKLAMIFTAWRNYICGSVYRLKQISRMESVVLKRHLHYHFICWVRYISDQKLRIKAVERLRVLMERHAIRRYWNKWSWWSMKALIDSMRTEFSSVCEDKRLIEDSISDMQLRLLQYQHEIARIQQNFDTQQLKLIECEERAQESKAVMREKLDVYFIKRQIHCIVKTYLTLWVEVSNKQIGLYRLQKRWQIKLAKQKLLKCVCLWFLITQHNQDRVRLLQQFIARRGFKKQDEKFNQWKDHIKRKKHLRKVGRKLRSRLQQLSKIQMFNNWISFCQKRADARILLTSILNLRYGLIISSAFYIWIKDTKQHLELIRANMNNKKLEEVQRYLREFKRRENTIRLYYNEWSRVTLTKRLNIHSIQKMRNRVLRRCTWKAWSLWVNYHYHYKQKKHTLCRLIAHKICQDKAQALCIWARTTVNQRFEENSKVLQTLDKNYNLHKEMHIQKEVLLQQNIEEFREQSCFMQVNIDLLINSNHRYSNIIIKMSGQLRRMAFIRRVWKQWEMHVRRSHFVIELQEHRLSRLISSILQAWHKLSIRNIRFKLTVKLFSLYWTMHFNRWCFTAWKLVAARSLTINTFAQQHKQKTKIAVCYTVFSCWRRHNQVQIMLTQVLYIIQKKYTQMCSRCFSIWAGNIAVSRRLEQSGLQRLKISKLQSIYSHIQDTLCIDYCFQLWKLQATRQRFILLNCHRLQLMITTNLVKNIFSSWHYITFNLKRQRQWLLYWLQTNQFAAVSRYFIIWREKNSALRANNLKELKQNATILEQKLVFARNDIQNMTANLSSNYRELEAWKTKHARVQSSLLCAEVLAHWKYLLITKSSRMPLILENALNKMKWSREISKLFFAWKLLTLQHEHTRQTADFKFALQSMPTVFRIFQGWKLQLQFKRKFNQIVDRRILSQKRDCLVKWRSFLHEIWKAKCLLDTYDHTQFKAKIYRSFMLWRGLCLEHRRSLCHARLVRVFVEKREKTRLANGIYVWRMFVQDMITVQTNAETMIRFRHLRLITTWFKSWKLFYTHATMQKRALQRRNISMRKYNLRAAFQKWTTFNRRYVIQTLMKKNAELLQRLNDTSSAFTKKAAEYNEQIEVIKRENNLQLEEVSASLRKNLESQRITSILHERMCILMRMILRTHKKSQSISAYFMRWHQKTAKASKLAIASIIFRRFLIKIQKEIYFRIWRREILVQAHLDIFIKNNLNASLERSVRIWHMVTKHQRRKLELLRRTALIYRGKRIERSVFCLSFNLWKQHTISKELVCSLQSHKISHIQLESELKEHLKKRLIAKYMCRTYLRWLKRARNFFSCSQRQVYKSRKNLQQARIQTVQDELLKTKENLQAAELKLTSGSYKTPKEHDYELSPPNHKFIGRYLSGLRILYKCIGQAQTARELFKSVSSGFASLAGGISAILFLFDPSRNELWTVRDDSSVMQISATIGIAGYTLSSFTSCIVEDPGVDHRYHPAIDSIALSALQHQISSASSIPFASYGLGERSALSKLSLLNISLSGQDGSALGVLQVAFLTQSSGSHSYLYHCSCSCTALVEQIINEMLRNCRDQIQAKSPQYFMKMFKQNKKWRKFYLNIAKKVKEKEDLLVKSEKELEFLKAEKGKLQESLLQLEHKICAMTKFNESKVNSSYEIQIIDLKNKVEEYKLLVSERDSEIKEKTRGLEILNETFNQYRIDSRSKELEEILSHARAISSSSSKITHHTKENGNYITTDSDNVLRAEHAALQSKLVRVESDNVILIKAIDMAIENKGELSKTMKMEVNRVVDKHKITTGQISTA